MKVFYHLLDTEYYKPLTKETYEKATGEDFSKIKKTTQENMDRFLSAILKLDRVDQCAISSYLIDKLYMLSTTEASSMCDLPPAWFTSFTRRLQQPEPMSYQASGVPERLPGYPPKE